MDITLLRQCISLRLDESVRLIVKGDTKDQANVQSTRNTSNLEIF